MRAIIPRGDTGGHHNPVRVSILPIAPDGSLRNEYFLGTEDGDILYGGIKLVKDGDSGKMVAPRPLWIGKGLKIPINFKREMESGLEKIGEDLIKATIILVRSLV